MITHPDNCSNGRNHGDQQPIAQIAERALTLTDRGPINLLIGAPLNTSIGINRLNRTHRLVLVVAIANLFSATCWCQTIPTTQADNVQVEIPFTLTQHNNIVVAATINGADKLNLMLHTAASDVMLTEDGARKSKSVKFSGSDRVKSWGGEANSRFSKGNQIQIGDLRRDNVEVREDKFSGRDTDGKFGLDFFANRIVELDFDRSRIALHNTLPRKMEKYDRLKIENQNGLLFVQAGCLIEGKTYPNKFLLHSGYSGGVLLDDAFAAKAGVDGKIKVTDESSLKDSFGHTIKVKKGVLPTFVLGKSRISNAPVGFFAGAIGSQKMSIIGGEILKRFNIVFDLAKGDLYISLRRT